MVVDDAERSLENFNVLIDFVLTKLSLAFQFP